VDRAAHPLRDGSAIILRILRESGTPQALTAPQGMFQQMLGGKTRRCCACARSDRALRAEISANKYVLNIRFLQQNGESDRGTAHRRLGLSRSS
jgi:cell division protein ZapD